MYAGVAQRSALGGPSRKCRFESGPPAPRVEGRMVKRTERWRELCKQASKEQDFDKLMELTREILPLLDERFKLPEYLASPLQRKKLVRD